MTNAFAILLLCCAFAWLFLLWEYLKFLHKLFFSCKLERKRIYKPLNKTTEL